MKWTTRSLSLALAIGAFAWAFFTAKGVIITLDLASRETLFVAFIVALVGLFQWFAVRDFTKRRWSDHPWW
jgi:hypothetical protein